MFGSSHLMIMTMYILYPASSICSAARFFYCLFSKVCTQYYDLFVCLFVQLEFFWLGDRRLTLEALYACNNNIRYHPYNPQGRTLRSWNDANEFVPFQGHDISTLMGANESMYPGRLHSSSIGNMPIRSLWGQDRAFDPEDGFGRDLVMATDGRL